MMNRKELRLRIGFVLVMISYYAATLTIPSAAQQARSQVRCPSPNPEQPKVKMGMIEFAYFPSDLKDLTRRSDEVVIGTVSEVLDTYYSPLDSPLKPWCHRTILSDVQVTITIPIKGSLVAGQKLVLTEMQGTLNGVMQIMDQVPAMKVGEEYVLFLTKHESKWDQVLPVYGIPRFHVSFTWVGRFPIGMGRIVTQLNSESNPIKLARDMTDQVFIQSLRDIVDSLSAGAPGVAETPR